MCRALGSRALRGLPGIGGRGLWDLRAARDYPLMRLTMRGRGEGSQDPRAAAWSPLVLSLPDSTGLGVAGPSSLLEARSLLPGQPWHVPSAPAGTGVRHVDEVSAWPGSGPPSLTVSEPGHPWGRDSAGLRQAVISVVTALRLMS